MRRPLASEDYGEKVDLYIGTKEVPIQVSTSLKSNGEQERLRRCGIVNIAAGPDYSDDQIAASITNAMKRLR